MKAEIPSPEDPHRFDLKGVSAEEFLHTLAKESFFLDWCFLNPTLPNGKELCDLLVVFDNIAIIWQAKALKLHDGRYKLAEVQKNLRQLVGARRKLFVLRAPVELENARRVKEAFDPTRIKEVFLVSALLGEGEDFYSSHEKVKGHTIHVFTRAFTEIALKELDTLEDFVTYLRAKERFQEERKGGLMVTGGEEQMLAYYLFNDRTFDPLLPYSFVSIDDTYWESLRADPKYLAKREADRVSYGWDGIIDRVHEGSPEYERVARELARPNRFERRVLSQDFLDAHIKAHEDTVHDILRRVSVATDPAQGRNTTWCFLFVRRTVPRQQRIKMLEHLCLVARGKFPQNSKVIGIATEKEFEESCSYDFVVLDLPEWMAEHQATMDTLQRELGLLTSPTVTGTNAQEYPDVPTADPA